MNESARGRGKVTASDLKLGDVFLSKSGEILEFEELTADEACFRIRNPKTLAPTDFFIYGPIKNFNGFFDAAGLKRINLNIYKPPGYAK